MALLEIRPASPVRWPSGGGFQPYELRIDGRPLLELVRAEELPFAEREFDERTASGETEADLGPRGALAGDYLGLPASYTFLPSKNLLGAPYDRGKSLLLQCTCGITECWFLLARVEVLDEHVTWSDFEQSHRDWRYDLGPFVFPRVAYEAALAPPERR